MKKIIVLIGPPCSGKSTYAKEKYPELEVLSRDDLITQLYPNLTYDDAWEIVDQDKINGYYDILFKGFLSRPDSFIIDKTNMTRKGRQKIFELGRKNGFEIEYILFLVSFETLIKRNGNRPGKQIPQDVIFNMISSFCFPSIHEYDKLTIIGE